MFASRRLAWQLEHARIERHASAPTAFMGVAGVVLIALGLRLATERR
jgi:threonine/homoserine/homoserine lactone efflux protein